MDQIIDSGLEELCISENGRLARRRRSSNKRDENGPGKSKNLVAERKRRKKLHDRLMELRGLVPNITNMKKATIVEDAIAHIRNLLDLINHLNEILDSEASSEFADAAMPREEQTCAEEDFKESRIQADVSVVRVCENKLWIKVVSEQKPCGFTKLVEAVSGLGFEFSDTSMTMCNRAMLLTSTLEGYPCASVAVEEMKALLLEIVKFHLV